MHIRRIKTEYVHIDCLLHNFPFSCACVISVSTKQNVCMAISISVDDYALTMTINKNLKNKSPNSTSRVANMH